MDKKLFKSILLILTYAIVLVIVLVRLDAVGGALRALLKVFQPVFLGFALAFVLNRPCEFFLRRYRKLLGSGRGSRAARPLAVVTSYLALIAAVAALFAFVMPRLVKSIQTFAGRLGEYIGNIQGWLDSLPNELNLDSPDLTSLNEALDKLFGGALDFLSDLGPHLLNFTGSLISMVVTGVLALAFSIYMLSSKNTLLRQCRRLLDAYVPKRVAGPLLDVVHLTSATFTNFVTGQLIEACILGGLCAAGMLFIQADYAALIGVIVGVCALIPVAGAYVGAIVSALLLLMVSPLKALTFLVFLVILQQVEGNVIYPKVVGTSIGLPGIWVLAAVTVGGGLFGLWGILFSVPVASVLYTLLRRDVAKRLGPAKP